MGNFFNRATALLSEESGCDWDFLVDMYNYILDKYGDVDWERFVSEVNKHSWDIRGTGRFEDVLKKLSEDSGYDYDFLFGLYVDMVYDPDDDGDWEYFVGVTMEYDW